MNKSKKSSFLKSDKNLFLKLKRYKDKQAFLDAYDLYIDDIYRFIFFKINNKSEAEDITSSVFIKCWTYVKDGKLNDDNEYKSLKSLIYKIARNLIIDYYRQNKHDVELEEAENVIDEKQDIQKQVDLKIDFELVRARLIELKTSYRGIIVMHYINELTIAEISDILGKSKGTVRVTLHRAMNALKDLTNNENK